MLNNNKPVIDLIKKAMSQSKKYPSVYHELDDYEAAVITLRFGLISKPYTLEEAGELLNQTKESIRQTESKCMAKLSKFTRKTISHCLENHKANMQPKVSKVNRYGENHFMTQYAEGVYAYVSEDGMSGWLEVDGVTVLSIPVDEMAWQVIDRKAWEYALPRIHSND